MSEARRGLCALVIIVMVSVPLAGYVASEDGPISTQEGKGLVGGFIAQLHQEDEEADARESTEHEPTREERDAAREEDEARMVEEAQAQRADEESQQG